MNDDQHRTVQAYAQDLAGRLLLRDWEVQVFRDPPYSDHAYASAELPDSQDKVIVRLCQEYFGYSPEYQRLWMTHELMHAYLTRVQDVMDQLKDQFPDNTAIIFAKQAHHLAIEVVVQRLARLLAPIMPLPILPPGVNY